ncbi:MAG TPA: PLDc N-terminal domain-containing protein [Microbacterium sp.]|nr:PLDc N-terminal domain-containing protein [Microbacterium sp.]
MIFLARSASRLTITQGLIWTLVILLLPVLGPIAWLVIGCRTADLADRGRP